MALSLESPNLVRQKVYSALISQAVGGSSSAKQRLWWVAAREFFNQWVNQGNADLQFVPFSEADADDADGTGLLDAASKIYIMYVKKLNAATENTIKAFESATVDTGATTQTLSIILNAANQEAMLIYPTGFAQATGLTVTQHTTIEGSTDGDDGADGFFVVGAA